MSEQVSSTTIESIAAACLELPWLDEVRLAETTVPGVTIIPSDEVSEEEKIFVSFEGDRGSRDRVLALLQQTANLLSLSPAISAVVHQGGIDYSLIQENGQRTHISAETLSPEVFLRVLFLFKEIALTAQVALTARAAS